MASPRLSNHAPGDNPFSIDRRNDKSIPMKVLQTLIKPLKPHLVKAKSTKDLDRSSPRLNPPEKLRKTHHVEERCVDGIWIYDVTAKTRTDKDIDPGHAAKRIYYVAGGGWQMPPSPQHWALATALTSRLPRTTMTIIAHPLAPESPASQTMPRLKVLYQTLMEQSAQLNECVIFAGDSSGGNIVLCLILWVLATEGRNETEVARVPAAMVAISPSTDLRHAGPDLESVGKLDPIMTLPYVKSTAAAWCAQTSGEWTVEDPRVSPILGPVDRLAARGIQVHGVIGTLDVLAPEALVFMEKCRELGVAGKWLVHEGQMHCHLLAFSYGLRESRQALEWLIDVVQSVKHKP